MANRHYVIGDEVETDYLKELAGPSPEFRFTETDQTDPAGRYRLRVQDDVFYLERTRAGSVEWALAQTILETSADVTDTDEPITILYGQVTIQNFGANWSVPIDAFLVQPGYAVTGANTPSSVAGIFARPNIEAANTRNWTATIGLSAFESGGILFDDPGAGGAYIITGIAGLRLGADDIGANVTVTNRYGVYAAAPTVTGTLTNQYGVYIENVTQGATLNYGLFAVGGASAAIAASGAAGTTNQRLLVENTTNTAVAAHAYVEISVGGTTSTGSPQLRLTIPSGTSWYLAADNTRSDRLSLGTGTTVGGGNFEVLTVDPANSGAASYEIISLQAMAGWTATNSAAAQLVEFAIAARTLTLSGTTQVTALSSQFVARAMTINQTGGAVTVNAAAGVVATGATAGASVTLTHSSAFRALTGGAAVNVSGLHLEAQTAGTTGNYQMLLAVSTGARPALANFAAINAIDFAVGDTRLMVQTELGIEIAIGNSTIQSNSATEMAFCVTNEALTVGSEGSVILPYISQAAVAFSDALGGNLNGAIGINHDSTPGLDTIEVRVEAVWLSVAVAGVLMQNRVPLPDPAYWTHPGQVYVVNGQGWLDESKCVVCGDPIERGQQATFWANYQHGRGTHAVFGHLHPEREEYIQSLERRIEDLERQLSIRGLEAAHA